MRDRELNYHTGPGGWNGYKSDAEERSDEQLAAFNEAVQDLIDECKSKGNAMDEYAWVLARESLHPDAVWMCANDHLWAQMELHERAQFADELTDDILESLDERKVA